MTSAVTMATVVMVEASKFRNRVKKLSGLFIAVCAVLSAVVADRLRSAEGLRRAF